jgi:hypothetical protein
MPVEMHADTKRCLRDILSECQESPVQQLLEIQRCASTEEKSFEWARNLTCLYTAHQGRKRRRVGDDNYAEVGSRKVLHRNVRPRYHGPSSYVAVSYCWAPSKYEDPVYGGYNISTAEGGSFTNSVRDVVLDRAFAYADHVGVDGIWIDQGCINQEDSGEKELAMQSMDLVYRNSDHPLGVLSVQITSRRELESLSSLLSGDYMQSRHHSEYPLFNRMVTLEKANEVLQLLCHITSDLWWTRAWIFQEDYLSSIDMS